MLTFAQFIVEVQLIHRIDQQPIQDFGKRMKSYNHTPDWTQSGQAQTGHRGTNRRIAPGMQRSKGLFGGDKHTVSSYSGPRHVPWVQHYDAKGQSHMTFAKHDEQSVRNHRPVLSSFKKSAFQQLPNGNEHFSSNPGAFVHQRIIHDPVKFMQQSGHQVHFTNNLGRHFKKIQASGLQHGAEGL